MGRGSLADFRTTDRIKKREPRTQSLDRKIMAFDQTLTNTGWAVFIPHGLGSLVADVGTIKQPASDYDVKGHALMFQRCEDLAGEVEALLSIYLPETVVIEMPTVGGGMYRPESILLAGATICVVARNRIPVVMVNNQQMKTVLTGDRKASKKDLRGQIHRLQPEVLNRKMRLNEHIYDAVGLGITAILTGVIPQAKERGDG